MIANYQQELVSLIMAAEGTKTPKKVRYRSKIRKSGNRMYVMIPRLYHQDIEAKKLVNKTMQVEMTEVPETGEEVD